jgi:hypothetical protein
MSNQYMICVNNESFEVHLTRFRVYRVIPSKLGDKLGLIRLVDDSGEDYAYPAPMFHAIELPADVEKIYEVEAA